MVASRHDQTVQRPTHPASIGVQVGDITSGLPEGVLQRKIDGESPVRRIVCFVRGARTRTLIGQSGVYAKFREYPQLQDEPDSDEK